METATQRVKALVEGKRVRPQAISMWKHFPITDRDPEGFVKRTISFQDANHWDFVKISYHGLYSVEDWGSQIRWPATEQEVGVVSRFGIQQPSDWTKLRVLDTDRGAMARELAATRRIAAHFKGSVPVLGTVFSPLTTAIKMCDEPLFAHMRSDAAALHRGLEVITATTVAFVRELMAAGVDGVFFATQLGTTDRMTVDGYREFGRQYDIPVLEAAASGWFNILHLHGKEPMFAQLQDYPVQAINWHDRITAFPLSRGRSLTDKVLIGGVDENGTLLTGSDADIEREVKDAIAQVPDGRLVLGPGCVVPLTVNESRLAVLKRYCSQN